MTRTAPARAQANPGLPVYRNRQVRRDPLPSSSRRAQSRQDYMPPVGVFGLADITLTYQTARHERWLHMPSRPDFMF